MNFVAFLSKIPDIFKKTGEALGLIDITLNGFDKTKKTFCNIIKSDNKENPTDTTQYIIEIENLKQQLKEENDRYIKSIQDYLDIINQKDMEILKLKTNLSFYKKTLLAIIVILSIALITVVVFFYLFK